MGLKDLPFEKGLWDEQLEFGLPDARLVGDRARKQFEGMTVLGRMWMEKVFCVNCGCNGGAVTPEWAAHVFYLCEECAYKYGAIEGAVEVPENEVRGQQ